MGVLRFTYETYIDRTFRTLEGNKPAEDSIPCLDIRATHATFHEISDRLWDDLKPTKREIGLLKHFENPHVTGVFLDEVELIFQARQSQRFNNLHVIQSGDQKTQPENESSRPAWLTLQIDAMKFPLHQFQIERKALLELIYFFREEYSIVDESIPQV